MKINAQYKVLSSVATIPEIWQYKFLNPSELSIYCYKHGLDNLGKDAIKKLWQIGLLRADFIISPRKIRLLGLIHCKYERKRHYYIDHRILRRRHKGWANAASGLRDIPIDLELYFHPFRFYVLYRLTRMLKLNIHSLQFLYSLERLPDLTKMVSDNLQKWSQKQEFVKRVNEWNETLNLVVTIEPLSFQKIFGILSRQVTDTIDSLKTKIETYKKYVKKDIRRVGLNHIEKIRKELCVNAELIDPNKVLHVLLRLMNARSRQKLEGKIGGAMLLLTMAEMLRRFSEEVFKKQLPEEDEFGFGVWTQGARKFLYGSERVLDAPRNISNELMRQHGLDYGVRIRCYVEGETEYGALNSIIKPQNGIELINLGGKFIEANRKGLAFRESLRNDKKSRIFSVVVLDNDRSDFVRAVRKAAEQDQICGLFYILEPDFELANFTVDELGEIIWQIAVKNGAKKTSKKKLLDAIDDASSGGDIIKSSRNTLVELSHLSKGTLWGEALADYAFKHPNIKKTDTKNEKDRPFVEIVRKLINGLTASYISSCDEMKVDPATGKLVPR